MSTQAQAMPLAAGQLAVGPAIYRGFTVRETTGTAAAVVRIWNGTAAAGTLLDTIQLPQGTDDRGLDQVGVAAANGIFVEIVSGAVEGSVYIG